MWTGSVNYSLLFCTRPQQRDSGSGGGTEANKENKKREFSLSGMSNLLERDAE